MKRFLVLLGISAFLAINAFGDVPRPDIKKTPPVKKAKSIDGNLRIRLDSTETEARLIIPKSQLSRLRAELERLDDDSNETTAASSSSTAPWNFTRTQTIVSGLFLSLGMVFGGMWLARGGGGRKTSAQEEEAAAAATDDKKTSKKFAGGAAVVCLLCSAAATTFVFANAGPPTQLRSIHSGLFDRKTFSGWSLAWGDIKVEVSDDRSTNFELIVPDRGSRANAGSEEE